MAVHARYNQQSQVLTLSNFEGDERESCVVATLLTLIGRSIMRLDFAHTDQRM